MWEFLLPIFESSQYRLSPKISKSIFGVFFLSAIFQDYFQNANRQLEEIGGFYYRFSDMELCDES